ncbi:hypothetical protein CCF12_003904 [Escherichia albertii]|nr:hypothetical protein [Escherichia albertii]
MNRILYGVIIVLLMVCSALWLATEHYRDNAIMGAEAADAAPAPVPLREYP